MAMAGIGVAQLLLLAALLLGGGAPLGGAPLPPDAGLQAAAPPSCLLYASHHGLAAPDPKSPNHFEQLLAEPENQAFFAELNRLADAALKLVPADDEPARLLGATMPTLIKTLISRPSVLYLSDVSLPPNAPAGNAAFVIYAGDQSNALREVIEQWERFYLSQIPPNQTVTTTTIDGVDVRQLPLPPGAPPIVWGTTDGYFFVAVGEGEAKGLLGRLLARGAAPEWLQKLTQEARVPRVGGLLYLNAARIFQLAEPFIKLAAAAGMPFDLERAIDAIGLRQLQYIALASGLDETTSVSKLLIGHDAGAKGVLELLHGKPLGKDDFAGIPRSADFALVTRVDGATTFQRIVDGVAQVDANAALEMEAALGQAEEQIGFGVKRDLLDGLGDVWSLYNSPTEGGSLLTGACVTVTLRDRAKVERVVEQLLRIAAAELGRSGKPEFALRKTTVGERTITYLQFPREPIPVAPAWCLTADRLVFALSPQMVRAHLARAADAGSLADLEPVAKQLATGDVTMLSYADTRFGVQILYSYLQYGATVGAAILEKETGIQADLSKFPSFTAIAPHIRPSIGVVRSSATVWSTESYAAGPSIAPITLLGVGAAIVTPAVASARTSARQVVAANNLRQLSVATAAYSAVHDKPLPRAIVSADGKPLLSWRVALLPYLERQDLYNRFHLDEPWDSDHNRPLIALMPEVYVHPQAPELRELGATPFQIPLGEGTHYGLGITPQSWKKIATAVLFVVANSDRAVVWTKPEDLEVDPDSPYSAFYQGGGQVQAAFIDGSVQSIRPFSDSPEERSFLEAMFPHK